MEYITDYIVDLFIRHNINFCVVGILISITINVYYYPLIKNRSVYRKLPTWKKSIIIQSFLITTLLLIFWVTGICEKSQEVLCK